MPAPLIGLLMGIGWAVAFILNSPLIAVLWMIAVAGPWLVGKIWRERAQARASASSAASMGVNMVIRDLTREVQRQASIVTLSAEETEEFILQARMAIREITSNIARQRQQENLNDPDLPDDDSGVRSTEVLRREAVTRRFDGTYTHTVRFTHAHGDGILTGSVTLVIYIETGLAEILRFAPDVAPYSLSQDRALREAREYIERYVRERRFIIEGEMIPPEIQAQTRMNPDAGLDTPEPPEQDANERAKSLLMELWGVDAEDEWMRVPSTLHPDHFYEIPLRAGPTAMIKVWQGDIQIGRYCVDISEGVLVPPIDRAIARRLWIEGDEEGFKNIANWQAPISLQEEPQTAPTGTPRRDDHPPTGTVYAVPFWRNPERPLNVTPGPSESFRLYMSRADAPERPVNLRLRYDPDAPTTYPPEDGGDDGAVAGGTVMSLSQAEMRRMANEFRETIPATEDQEEEEDE